MGQSEWGEEFLGQLVEIEVKIWGFSQMKRISRKEGQFKMVKDTVLIFTLLMKIKFAFSISFLTLLEAIFGLFSIALCGMYPAGNNLPLPSIENIRKMPLCLS